MNKLLILLFIFLGSLFAGCGISGNTRKFCINYEVAQLGKNHPKLELSRFIVGPEAPINQAVGVFNMGRFSESDRIKIEESFIRTFEQFESGYKTARIEIYLHRYALSFSNDEIAGLAVVDWCIKLDERIEFDELFYVASYSGESFLGISAGTLGSRKNKLNRAIVNYITDKTLSVVSKIEITAEHQLVFKSPLEALSVLPSRVDSSDAVVSTGNSMVFIPGGGTDSFFKSVITVDKVDWKEGRRLTTTNEPEPTRRSRQPE